MVVCVCVCVGGGGGGGQGFKVEDMRGSSRDFLIFGTEEK